MGGDCDSDDDCLHGLVCDADNWMGKDVCIAGPHTVDGFLTSWSSWSDCSAVACGTQGTQKREKFCFPPEFGGNDCPENALVEQLQSAGPQNASLLCRTGRRPRAIPPLGRNSLGIAAQRRNRATRERATAIPTGSAQMICFVSRTVVRTPSPPGSVTASRTAVVNPKSLLLKAN